MPKQIKYREQWLAEAMKHVHKLFKRAGYTIPDNVRIGVGWPSRGGLATKKRTLGQAWSNACSKDGSHEIIISIYMEDPVRVLDVLVHEVIHVTVGVDQGHGKPFVDAMKALGLEGKPTATVAGDELRAELEGWVSKLGPYPHAQLDGSQQKKQSTRLIKLECADCGCIVRASRKWIELYEYEEWPCPCGGIMEVEEIK